MHIDELKKVFKNKKYRIDKKGNTLQGFEKTTWEGFLGWFNQESFDKGCFYCGTTNARSFELYNLRPQATRGGKRGRRLELDRRDPNQHYDNLDNLVWCCYWCNNAKSNFFTEKEFRPIAIEVGKVLNRIQ